MADITLYTNPMSRGRIVHWLLEELQVPYDLKVLDFEKREHKSPEYLKINPMGKVPTLVHRGTVITEAAAICVYLADAFPKAGLAPALDDPQRGTYLRWLFFGAGCIEPAFVDKIFNRPAVERKGAVGYGSYDDTVNTLEAALTPGPWLLGQRFTAADIYVGAQVQWGFMVKALEPRPKFSQYMERIAARPALQKIMKGAQSS
jgi:glutathione S-transferase